MAMYKYERHNYDFSPLIENIDLNSVTLTDVKTIIENLSLDEVVGDNTSAPFNPTQTTLFI